MTTYDRELIAEMLEAYIGTHEDGPSAFRTESIEAQILALRAADNAAAQGAGHTMAQPAGGDAIATNLLPCPFCGKAEPFIVANERVLPEHHAIICSGHICGAVTYGHTAARARLRWNRRTSQPAGGEAVAWPEEELIALVAGPYMYHHKMDDATMREGKAFDRCRDLTIQNIRTWCAMQRAMGTTPPAAQVQQEAVVPAAALRALYVAYVRLLESGRDRIRDLGGDCDPIDVMERADVCLRAARDALASAARPAAAAPDSGRLTP